MNISLIYIAVSIGVLAVIGLLVYLSGRAGNEKRITPLASLAFGFVLAGIVFGEDRVVGYGLMGIGVLLAVIDIVNRSRRRR